MKGALHRPIGRKLLRGSERVATAARRVGYCPSSARPRAMAAGAGGEGFRGEVTSLNEGKSFQEEVSSETNTMVTDVMDIDRTPELLTWIFSGMFGKKEQPQTPQPVEQSVASESSGAAAGPSSGVAAASSGAAAGRPSAPASAEIPAPSTSGRTELATIGGGCFWCIEACFREMVGVSSVTSGYAGGHVERPTYQQVLTKKTGHAEVVQVEFDPTQLSYRDILQIFFTLHDPTTPNRQGNDVGPQYRSIILTHSDEQRRVAEEVLGEVNKGLWFGKRAVTELVPLTTFYPAEAYHQRYFARNPSQPYCAIIVAPKLQEFRRKYAKKLRSYAAPEL
ncbi:hypothetical protein CHLRE_06g257650v5 [Chlamydomonas reinhardtii]|uniref:peptide-methionine (S)-S-oxide reductase n=1 Tax=Chlamydomonas reinhardtii TaxID=3055 RepID=A8HXY3_CHLRE|nr:uncharacterized protein CHLRE_06g257650v5 [Chlamydomonas reinhardtii]PNW81725.1 hypothetical protein CHLRE_06g257650v5 [Chlamydomonas reinhardtii]|eukprot:XP_001696359.1 peptide methionine-S-sulfoxide reductase [Chlamydomonas reinhardtii]